MAAKPAVRIANASGFLGDRASALLEMVEGGPVDFITGDYLAEVTMLILGKQFLKDPSTGYAAPFLAHLEPALAAVLSKGVKIVVNAGGLNPLGLAKAVRALGERLGLSPRIATVQGDDLRMRLAELRAAGEKLANTETGEPLRDDPAFVLTANAYLGAWGIVRALEANADIVICPRVTDASLVVGAAAFWHGWGREDWNALAGAVAAGHVIECGAQATGGNYSSFRELGDDALIHPGFPIAEVRADGSSVITKHPGTGGRVTVGTVTAQLVYEVESTRYLNPDVITHLESLTLEEEGPDRVLIRGAHGSPPPPTTKVAMTTRGVFRNEMTVAASGLDIDAKFALLERTARLAAARTGAQLEFQRIGTPKSDAAWQNEGTVLLRIIATSEKEAAVGRAFSGAVVELGLSSFPGLFMLNVPGPAMEAFGYWPAKIAQARLEHRVTLPDGSTESIAPPSVTANHRDRFRTTGVATATAWTATGSRVKWGATRRLPLGTIADARSGDKGSDANVGIWVRSEAAFAWLLDALTTEQFRTLLPEAAGLMVERYELPKLHALNFVVRGLLRGGAVATLRLDRQAKSLGEFLRARVVDVPESLLAI